MERYEANRLEAFRQLKKEIRGSSAIMSPRNCLANMSPLGIGSVFLRRSYGQGGVDRESERSQPDARG